jgi:hypothetical protein
MSIAAQEGQSALWPNDSGVNRLVVPGSQSVDTRSHEDFRRFYHDLVIGTLLRSAEAELARHRAARHRLRARRAERMAERLRPLLEPGPEIAEVPTERLFGPGLRILATAAWLAAAALLIVDLAVFGIHSWTTDVGDLAMIALTLVWFVVNSGGGTRQAAETAGPNTAEPEASLEE